MSTSDRDGSFNFRGRFLKLTEIAVIMICMALLLTGVFHGWRYLQSSLREVSCRNNLQIIAKGLFQYQTANNNNLPPWIAALYPAYVPAASKFICPNDPSKGTKGCRPAWMKPKHDYKYADLDGPTGSVTEDTSWFPCSYFYAMSIYPSEYSTDENPEPYRFTWREVTEHDIVDYNGATPIVRCFYHLPIAAKPEDKPTFNVIFDLPNTRDCPWEWTLSVSAPRHEKGEP